MTSPNRETEAQQVEARVEQIVLTKVKASLREKTGTIRVNLEQERTITDQEPQKMVMISKADHQEMVREAALNQEKEETETKKILTADRQETAKEAALNQERETAVVSDREQEEMETRKILTADHQEMVSAAASDQKKETAADLPEMAKEAVTNQEKAEMVKAVPSGQKAREVPVDLRASSHVHSKKAVLRKCQEMKAAVM
jgi:hypothetical protein